MSLPLLLLGAAWAGDWGNPARQEGLFSAEITGQHTVTALEQQGCAEDADCSSRLTAQGPGLRVGLRPHPAVSLSAALRIPLVTHKGLTFEARAPVVGAGLALTLPLEGPRPALMLAASGSQGDSFTDGELSSSLRAWSVEAAGVLALGGLDQDVSAWVGAAGRVAGEQSFTQPLVELPFVLDPVWPVGLVGGAELFSAPLGAPWAERRARVSFGVELRGLDRWSGEAWAGVVW